MKLTRRKVLSGIAIAGASAGAGAGTLAFLSDTSESDITINVGSLSLSEPSPITWQEDPSTDGEDSLSERVTIENTGNLPSRRVSITDLQSNDWGLAKALEITDIRYGQDSMSSILSDVQENNNGNGIYDLHDLAKTLNNSEIQLDSLAGPDTLNAGEKAHLEIDAQFDYSKIPDSKAGKPLEVTITIRGRQDDSE